MLHRVKRTDDIHAGKWNGLGGKFEPGESPEECVTREVHEESGLEIVNPRLHGLVMFPGFKGADWYVFVFTAEKFSGDLKENGEGYLKWIPDTELASLLLWPSDHIFLPWLEGEKFFSAKFTYEGEEYLRHEAMFYP
jgi:8-oxo-dGTP diphosphatase